MPRRTGQGKLTRSDASLDLTKLGQATDQEKEQADFSRSLYPAPGGEGTKTLKKLDLVRGTKTVEDRAKELAQQRVPKDWRPGGRPVRYNEQALSDHFRKMAVAERERDQARAAEAYMQSRDLKDVMYESRVAPAVKELKNLQQELENKAKSDPKKNLKSIFTIGPSDNR